MLLEAKATIARGSSSLCRLGTFAAHLDDLNAALDMVTSRPATMMGLTHRNAVEGGQPADLVPLDARSAEEAVGAQAEKLHVIRRGRIVVRNEREITAT